MKNLAIIPARSGSKGLKDKNIALLNGKPLLAYSIEASIKSNIFDKILVSTDSIEYADIAKQFGAEVPFLRSEENSSDLASTWNVVKEVLTLLTEIGESYDTVCVLQPTSPLRTSEDIINGYQAFVKKRANFIVGVTEMDHSPLWSNELPDDLSLKDFITDDVFNKARQQLPTYYRINGAIYIIKVEHLLTNNKLYDKKTFAYVMDKMNSVDIDDEFDMVLAKTLIDFSINKKI